MSARRRTEDSGSATGCRPICQAPATHAVTVTVIGMRFTYTAELCKRHADHAPARHYPYPVTVAPIAGDK